MRCVTQPVYRGPALRFRSGGGQDGTCGSDPCMARPDRKEKGRPGRGQAAAEWRTVEECRAALAALADRTGILEADKADWMIPGIIEGDWANAGSGPTITAWKNTGDLVSVEDKRRMTLNTRVKLSWPLVETLTGKGLVDLNESLEGIYAAPIEARNRARPNVSVASEAAGSSQAMIDYINSKPQRLSAVMDNRTCAVAKAAHGTVYAAGQHPALPLPGCDALSCRCTYVTHYPKRDPAETAAVAARVDAKLAELEAVSAKPLGLLARIKRLFA